MPTYDDDLRLAHVLANAVEPITMGYFRAANLQVSAKPDLSPVTDADVTVEETIRSQLKRSRRSDAMLGEEQGIEGAGSRLWIIDPIDGTKNFVRGVPVWATLIALVVDNMPVVGLVAAPALGRRWWAKLGTGAWSYRNPSGTKRIGVSGVSSLSDASLSLGDWRDWSSIDRREEMLDLLDVVWQVRGYGDFWSHVLVAEGACDIAPEPKLEVYDIAALAPIVVEAGGRFTGLDGRDGPWSGNAVSTNKLLHDEVLARIGTKHRPVEGATHIE